jgi:RNA polymerase sigma factor (sigma-70 family)
VDDEGLYMRMRRGDKQACAELVNRYHSAIYKFLVRQLGESTTADDLAQETFVRLITHRGTPPRQVRAWLYTVARNLAADYWRTAHRESDFLPEDVSTESTDGSGIDVKAALSALSPEHREVVLLRFYHDLHLDEIATIVGVPLGTVKSRLYYALKQLKGIPVLVGYDE